MAYTNMKKPKRPKKDNVAVGATYPEDKYPYGLEISLNNDSLKKLNLGAGNFKVGSGFEIKAKVKVTSVRANEREGSGTDDGVGLQITDLDLGMTGPKKSAFQAYQDVNNKIGGVI